MTEAVIRRAGAADAEALARIAADTFVAAFGALYAPADLEDFLRDTHGLEATRRELADPAVGAWLMEVDGTPVGYALAGACTLANPEVTAACGELKRIYLLPAWQGGGRGSRLLEAALAWLERDGPRRLWIGVYSGNLAAQRLYARHGFEKVGEHAFVVGGHRDLEFTLRRG